VKEVTSRKLKENIQVFERKLLREIFESQKNEVSNDNIT
jgi:hypothetical protein